MRDYLYKSFLEIVEVLLYVWTVYVWMLYTIFL